MRLASLSYVLGNYQDSTILFRQAVSLKPDWANARFNLGWSLYQQQEYQAAATEMQTVLTLLDDDKESQDYKNAQNALEAFKQQIELTQQQQQEAAQGDELNLPQQQTPELSPKLQLPETASPGAN
jgi:tetratricopeptide (TPR) repeat protein